MTRAFVALLLALALPACTDGNAPHQLVSAGGDQGIASEDMLPNGNCATACDCPAGQACRMGSCQTLATPVFCCSAPTCASSAICEFPNGTISQCDHLDGGAVTPVTDGGTPSSCEMRHCTKGLGGDAVCRFACGGTATCVGSGGNQHCMP